MSRWQSINGRARQFDPRTIRGIALWLDATDSTTTVLDAGVTTWRDKSGAVRDFTQTVGNNQPTIGALNGRRALAFNGTSAQMTRDILPSSLCDTSGAAAFVVFHPSSDTTYSVLHVGGNTAHRDRFSDNRSYSATFRSPRAVALEGKMPTSTPAILTHHVVHESAHIIRLNRVQERSDALSSTSTFTSWRGLTTGITCRIGVGAEQSDFLSGVIGEILIYGRAITAAEVVRVENYLARKWGVA